MNRHFRASHPEPFRHVIFYSNGRVPRLCPKKHKVAAGKPLHAGGPRAARAIPTPSGNSKSSRKLGYAWLNVQHEPEWRIRFVSANGKTDESES